MNGIINVLYVHDDVNPTHLVVTKFNGVNHGYPMTKDIWGIEIVSILIYY